MAEKWERCLRFHAVAAFNLFIPQTFLEMSRTQSGHFAVHFLTHLHTCYVRIKSSLRSVQQHIRSHGQRGADVETLRGTSGANYEGEAKVKRGGSNNGFCGCFGGSSDGEPVSLV